MKMMMLGIAWQVMGLFGAIRTLCAAAPNEQGYNGEVGLIADLQRLQLMTPFVLCIVVFVLGVVAAVIPILKDRSIRRCPYCGRRIGPVAVNCCPGCGEDIR